MAEISLCDHIFVMEPFPTTASFSPKDHFITIFGINMENLPYVFEAFKPFHPKYFSPDFNNHNHLQDLDASINREEESDDSGKGNLEDFSKSQNIESQSNDRNFDGNFAENNEEESYNESEIDQLLEAFQKSNGNWVLAKFPKSSFTQIELMNPEFVLENNDIVYCMIGRYFENSLREFPCKQGKKKESIEDLAVLKIPKGNSDLISLPFDKKSFEIKFEEFIFGNRTLKRGYSRFHDIDINDPSLYIYICISIFFIVFCYRLIH